MRRWKVSDQTLLLAAIGLLDLIITVWLVRHRGAWEANPLMARFLEHSVGLFVFAKLALLAAPLVILEWARRRKPIFVRRACNVAVVSYLCFYVVGFVRANSVHVPSNEEIDRELGPIWQLYRARMRAIELRNTRPGTPLPSAHIREMDPPDSSAL